MSRPGEKASAFVKKLLESKTYNWFDNKRELLTVLVSTVGYGLIVVTVLFAATVIIVVSLLYFTGPETIKFFEKGKGLVLTSYATIAGAFFIPILIALIPSQTSVKVDKIMQRLFSSLDDTDHVWKKAIELLEWVNDESHTEFYYTSATPYFGLYKEISFLNKDDSSFDSVEKWKSLLNARLVASKKEPSVVTSIHSLVWEPFSSGRSSLYGLCRRLCVSSGTDVDNKHVNDLFDKALCNWEEFGDAYRLKQPPGDNFNVYVSNQIPEFFVFYAEKKLIKRAIIAFFPFGGNNFKMSGIYTEDDDWVKSVKEMLISREKDSISSFNINSLIANDKRDESQRNRDRWLLHYFCSRRHDGRSNDDYKYNISGSPAFDVKINNHVFPFADSKEVSSWAGALEWVNGLEELKGVGKERKVGIDINTGCGVLALHLSTFCENVYATEHDSKAMGNALVNFNDQRIQRCLKRDHGPVINGCGKINAFCSNGIVDASKANILKELLAQHAGSVFLSHIIICFI